MTTTESTTTLGHDNLPSNYYQAGIAMNDPDRDKFVELDTTVEMIRQARDHAQRKLGMPGAAAPSYDDLLHIIDMLTAKMDTMVQGHHLSILTRRNISNRMRRFEQDIETMNGILNDAAEAADLCENYERALDEVNNAVSSFELTGRKREWTAKIVLTVQVNATSEEHADELFGEIENTLYHHADNLGCMEYEVNEASHDAYSTSIA